MGAPGLEGRGRRPQGKGCLLLAVAGATSLVTLLLAVPITVLAVLALVPQEQGELVTGTADPGTQAEAQQRLGKSRPSPSLGFPAPIHLHPQTPSPSRNPGAPPLGPGALSAGGAAPPPVVHASPPSRVQGDARGGGRNRSQPQAPSCPPHWRLDHGSGARLGGEERRGVSEERDAVLWRGGPGPPAGRPLLPLLSRRLPGPGTSSRRGPPGPLGHAAQPAVPGGGRLRTGDSRAAAGGRGDCDSGLGPQSEARVRAPLVHERGVRWPGAAPEGREGVR
uniref:Lymphotoxin beta (TNF superfamily, member 3) n=1 Tax=Sus scrofa TaxID=9823 RepID=A5D9N5_PIG|nr:lymphotoxin beta (TNF superfamily, member 3) [Sus scrofa]